MATFDYAEMRDVAVELIAEFGQSATLTKTTNSGTAYAPTQTTTDTTIVAVDLNRLERDGAGVLTGHARRTLYVSTSAGVTPAKGDKVTLGGAVHEIDEVRPLSPGGTILMWECLLAA